MGNSIIAPVVRKKNGSRRTSVFKSKLTRDDEIKILRELAKIISSELDLSVVLNHVVSFVSDATKADSVFIYLNYDSGKELTLMGSKTPHKRELGKIMLKFGEGITGWVAKENKPVSITKNAYKDTRFKGFDVLPEDKYEAFLSVPIVYRLKNIGVINIQHQKQTRHSKNMISLIAAIADQVGGLIENAQLYELNKDKARQFDSLVKVSKSITSEKYLDEILSLIVVVTAEMLNSKICSIMLIDEKGQHLEMKATQSLSESYKKKAPIKIAHSLSGDVIRSKVPRAVYDVKKEKKFVYRDLAIKEDLSSVLIIPMILKEKAIGVINVYTKATRAFSQEEINVLQIVAHQAAVAIENTKLMDETLKAREALETRKLVERAKGVIMRLHDIPEDKAYRLIHKKSMDTCKPMKEIAEAIILMAEITD